MTIHTYTYQQPPPKRELTVKRMCSSPRRISSSCFPTRSGSGQFLSSSLIMIVHTRLFGVSAVIHVSRSMIRARVCLGISWCPSCPPIDPRGGCTQAAYIYRRGTHLVTSLSSTMRRNSATVVGLRCTVIFPTRIKQGRVSHRRPWGQKWGFYMPAPKTDR